MNIQTILSVLALAVSILALSSASGTWNVLTDVYMNQTKARTSSSQGFADRWTATDHHKYSLKIESQIKALQKQIDELKKQTAD